MGVFKETGAQHYAATPLSAMLAGPDLRDEMKYLFVTAPPIPNGILIIILQLWFRYQGPCQTSRVLGRHRLQKPNRSKVRPSSVCF